MSAAGFPFGLRAHDYGRAASPAALAAAISARGASHLQLAPAKALAGVGDEPGAIDIAGARAIRAALEGAELRVSVLGCYVDLLAPEPGLRAKAEARLFDALGIAPALGAMVVATESFGARAEASPADFLRAIEPIAARAEALGVGFAVEPVAAHAISTPRLAAELASSLGSPRLRFILDPANLIGGGVSGSAGMAGLAGPALECLDLFADRIAAVHLKDLRFEGGAASTVPPGMGVFPFAAFFRGAAERGLRAPCIVEDCAPESLATSLWFLDAAGLGSIAALPPRRFRAPLE